MQDQTTAAIEKSISPPRLHSYQQLTGSKNPERNIGAYIWNKRVGAALYPLIQCLEVTLRNAIHGAATDHFNTTDWFDSVIRRAGDDYFQTELKRNPGTDNHFYRKGISTGPRLNRRRWTSRHENMVEQARDKLTNQGKKVIADAVVAELMFGFWVGLFEKKYNNINNTDRLWPHLESAVFPYFQRHERRATRVFKQLTDIKDLRNRMAHHEPVWKHPTVGCASTAVAMLNNRIDGIRA